MNVTATVTDKPSVILTWDKVPGRGYQVYRDGTLLHTGFIRQPTYEDFTVTADASYTYEVTSKELVGSASVDIGETLPVPEGTFTLASMPEFTFVRGFAEDEELAVYVLDEQNRQAAGDLWWKTPGQRLKNEAGGDYVPRFPIELEGTLPVGVTYAPTTGRLSYSGANPAAPNETAAITVTCGAAVRSTRIRIVSPTVVWGKDAQAVATAKGWTAAKSFPETQPFNDGSTTDVVSALNPNSTDDSPNVLFVTGGSSIECPMGPKSPNRWGGAAYFLGDPSNRPLLASPTGPMGVVMSGRPVTTFVVRNVRNTSWKIAIGAGVDVSRDIQWVVAKVSADDSVRGGENYLTILGYQGSESKTNFNTGSVTLWYVNSEAYEAGGSSTRHMQYVEGRPNSYLNQINVRCGGAKQASLCKSTMRHHTIAHCWFSTVRDPTNPTLGKRASKLIDIASAAEVCIFNNDFFQLRDRASGGLGGTPDGAIFFRRRETDIHGCDEPPSCDKSYKDRVTTVKPYHGKAVGSFPNTAQTYGSVSFWAAVNAKPISDETNPHTFKKYVAWNRFEWVAESTHRRPPFRDDGVAPVLNYVTEGPIYVIAAPPGFTDRSITFFANNDYHGWPNSGPYPDSGTDTDPFFNINDPGPPATQVVPGVHTYDDAAETVEVYDQSPVPTGWIFPPQTGPRAVRFLGGDIGPHTASDYPQAGGPRVALPPWFKLSAS
jgi:hypothetical protein